MISAEQIEHNDEPNYVAFRAASQDFCVDIMSVREIRGWTPATSLPKSPPYIRGVINLRGAVVPIIDFSVRLGMTTPEPTSRNVVIIVRIKDQTVGLLVDEVSEILNISSDAVKPTPDVGIQVDEIFLSGVISIEDQMVRRVDLEKIFPIELEEAV